MCQTRRALILLVVLIFTLCDAHPHHHHAVPHPQITAMQNWLMAMNPMAYPGYYMNMYGNPMVNDPKVYSGLVSGAAEIPYPMRNWLMSQRTDVPFNLAQHKKE